jgi:transcriptional regulator with XRE-family HTH domain
MQGRRRRVDGIPAERSTVVGANIRALRLRNGWTQAKLGELMGCPPPPPSAQLRGIALAGNEIQLRGGHAAGRYLRRLPGGTHDTFA